MNGLFMLQVPASAASSPVSAPAAASASPAAVKTAGKSRLKRLKKNPSAEAKAVIEVCSPIDDSHGVMIHLLPSVQPSLSQACCKALGSMTGCQHRIQSLCCKYAGRELGRL